MKLHALFLVSLVAVQAAPIALPHYYYDYDYDYDYGGTSFHIHRRGFFDSIGDAIGGIFGGGGDGGSSLGKIGSGIGCLFGGGGGPDSDMGKIGSVIGSVLDKDKSTGEKISDSKAGEVVKKIGDVAGVVLDKDKSLGDEIGVVAGSILGDSKAGETVKKIGDVIETVLDKDKSKGDKIGEIAGEVFGEGSKIDKIGGAVGAVLNKDGTAGSKISEAVGAVLNKDGGSGSKGAILGGGAAAGGVVAASGSSAIAAPAPVPPSSTDLASLPLSPEAKATPTVASPPLAGSSLRLYKPLRARHAPPMLPYSTTQPSTSSNHFEGFVPSPEPDPIGLPTVGFGHKCIQRGCSEVPFSFPLTDSTSNALLQSDAKKFTACLSQFISKNVKLNENQFGALTSWAFNVGCGAVKRSTLVRRLIRGEEPNVVAARELPRFNRAGGRVLKGLTRRRNAEVRLFQTPSDTIARPTC